MKLLSITIPCYNSEAYMRQCIDSLIIGGEDVEILIVNDGSKDGTQTIGEAYQAQYPSIVRLINQENGGHGAAVNTGIREATGLFFKVVDSDDWVKETAYLQILHTLRELTGGTQVLDMLISNFVYEKVGEEKHKVMSYRSVFPEHTMFTWKDVHHFRKGQYILMHSVIYRTRLLRECGLQLPEHTFYVDNIFVFEPLPYVKNMYYLDVNFYRYFIGREDQSVNEEVMIGRIDQQISVNKLMIDYVVHNGLNRVTPASNANDKKCRKYMIDYLDIITTISSIMLIRSNTEENLEKKKELWNYIKQQDRYLFHKLRYGLLGGCMNLPGRGGRKISVEGYKICKRFFQFN
ncbi:MAG: glycosyltransferase family A protein [Lachnospiraceae bacterium]